MAENRFTEEDLKNKGFVPDGKGGWKPTATIKSKVVKNNLPTPPKPIIQEFAHKKIAHLIPNKAKTQIAFILQSIYETKKIKFEAEHKFLPNRKFKFDYACIDLKIAVEYEGLISAKSRHTTISGYSKDTEKYNLAVINGWKVLRYTATTYKKLLPDLEKILLLNWNIQ